jgi:hypothetical protein
MKLSKWFMIFSIASSISYAGDVNHDEEVSLALSELKTAGKSIKVSPNSYNRYEIIAKITDRIKDIALFCSNPDFTDVHRTHSRGTITLAFTCLQKITYKSAHPMVQNLFPENDIVHNYLATLNERGEILSLVTGSTNLAVEEVNRDNEQDSYAYYGRDNATWDDNLSAMSLEILYAGYGYKGVADYAENLFPGEHDKYMHMLLGKMTRDFFTAASYVTIETNKQDPWRSKLVGFLAAAILWTAKEIVHDDYMGRGNPEVRDAVASSLGGLMTSFTFRF